MDELELDPELEQEEGPDATLVLTDENGNDITFEFADLLEYEGEEYVVLLPMDDEDTEVIILRVEADPDDVEMESYVGVDDEELLTKLFDLFKERNAEFYNFED